MAISLPVRSVRQVPQPYLFLVFRRKAYTKQGYRSESDKQSMLTSNPNMTGLHRE